MTPSGYEPVLVLTRGDIVESVHYGALAVSDASGNLFASYGDPDVVTFVRSSAKPFQAIPFLENGGDEYFDLTPRQIALICASHSGTDDHVLLLEEIQRQDRCKGDDQWCAISVFTEEEWRCFCRATGHTEWVDDERFANPVSRLRHADELDALVEEWTSEREPAEAMNTLQAVGVAAGVAARSVDALADPQLEHLNAFVEVDHPVAGKRLYPNIPLKITGMTFPESRPAPLFAEHTEEVCRDLLHMSEEEIARLVEEGVLEVAG